MTSEPLLQDARFAFRALKKQPLFVLAAVLTLGLGIGANVAMFSVVNLAIFRALPFPEPDRLVLGRTRWPGGGIGLTVSAPDYYDVRDRATSFESLSAITPFSREFTLTGGEAERVAGVWVSPGFFHTLGVTPERGREFRPEESEPGGPPVVILSHALWQRRFGANPAIIGTTATVDGRPRTVVGVMPAGFRFRVDADLWLPMVRGEAFAAERQYHNWLLLGRLRPGVSMAAAQSEVSLIMQRLAEAYPSSNKDKGMVITGLQETMFGSDFPSTLLMLTGTVALVVLIACANVAGLLLARASARRTEMALRSALGAGRWRLVRQLLTESALLGSTAGLLGTVVAVVLQRTLVAFTPLTRLGLEAAGLHWQVLAFALGLALVTVLLFGLAPAISAARVDLVEHLKEGARSVGAAARTRFRNALVVGQVALSVTLLIGAGLLVRSFYQLRKADPGFDPNHLVTTELSLLRARYPDPEQRVQFYDELLTRVRALPGVTHAALINRLPIRDPGGNVAVWDPAHPPADASQWRLSYARVVTPGYFETMGIPLRRGRDFQSTDTRDRPRVMIINETMARTLFPGEDPLGRRVAVDEGSQPGYYDVVGVVGDVRIAGLGSDVEMVMYGPYAQTPSSSMRLAVRVAGRGSAIVGPLRAIVRDMDLDVPVAGVATMEDVLSRSVSFTRAVTAALGLFAGAAILLAALGLYGVLAFFVTQRGREIGVRIALGATAPVVLKLVLRRGVALVGVGLVIGLAGALVGARLIRSMLFQIDATDPATFVGVSLLFLAVALAACLIPAWRASRVDPVVALRAE
jgi:putative ABC transport system permease protein